MAVEPWEDAESRGATPPPRGSQGKKKEKRKKKAKISKRKANKKKIEFLQPQPGIPVVHPPKIHLLCGEATTRVWIFADVSPPWQPAVCKDDH